MRLIKYIHYNAVHHEICTDIEDWYWSSYKTIISTKSTKLNREFIIEIFNGRKDFSIAHSEFPTYLMNLNLVSKPYRFSKPIRFKTDKERPEK